MLVSANLCLPLFIAVVYHGSPDAGIFTARMSATGFLNISNKNAQVYAQYDAHMPNISDVLRAQG